MYNPYRTTIKFKPKDLEPKPGVFGRLKEKMENYFEKQRKKRLITAVKNADVETFESLVRLPKYSELLGLRQGVDDQTLLMLAAKKGRPEMVEALLRHGANPNSLDMEKHSALIIAAYLGSEKIVRMLIEKGADVNTKDHDGWTPLMFSAIRRGNPTLEILLNSGANPAHISYDEMSPLKVALFYNINEDGAKVIRGYIQS